MEEKQMASDRLTERSIVDIIRDDQSSGSKKNWKAFRDKLRLKRTGKAWTSSVPIPASDVPIKSNAGRMMTRRGSWRYATDADDGDSDGDSNLQLGHTPERQRSGRLLPLETDLEEDDGSNPLDGEQKPVAGEGNHMSLMTLLSSDGSNYIDEEEEEEEEEEEHVEEQHEQAEEDEEEEVAGDCNVCSGCRGKHKGTALAPCGHTFCKHCTKELHVSRVWLEKHNELLGGWCGRKDGDVGYGL